MAMKHSNPANSSSTSAVNADGVPSTGAPPVGKTAGVHGERGPAQARAIALEATRELRSPIGALRVLLEGSRGSDAGASIEFTDRALDELQRVEFAADDIVAWTLPRPLRSTSTSLGEIAASLDQSLDASHRRRTHFVVEEDATALNIDAPLLVEALARTLRHAYRQDGTAGLEVMVHIHAADELATFSFIHTGSAKTALFHRDGDCVLGLADEILSATVSRLGGKTSIHDAEGHRCAVITLPIAQTAEDRAGFIQ